MESNNNSVAISLEDISRNIAEHTQAWLDETSTNRYERGEAQIIAPGETAVFDSGINTQSHVALFDRLSDRINRVPTHTLNIFGADGSYTELPFTKWSITDDSEVEMDVNKIRVSLTVIDVFQLYKDNYIAQVAMDLAKGECDFKYDYDTQDRYTQVKCESGNVIKVSYCPGGGKFDIDANAEDLSDPAFVQLLEHKDLPEETLREWLGSAYEKYILTPPMMTPGMALSELFTGEHNE